MQSEEGGLRASFFGLLPHQSFYKDVENIVDSGLHTIYIAIPKAVAAGFVTPRGGGNLFLCIDLNARDAEIRGIALSSAASESKKAVSTDTAIHKTSIVRCFGNFACWISGGKYSTPALSR